LVRRSSGGGPKEAAGLPLGPGRRKAEVGPCPFGQRTASRRAATPLHYGGRGALCALVIRPIFRRPLKGGFLMPLSQVGEHHQPSLFPLFTGVRERVVLGTSPTSGSRKSSVHRTGATRRRWPEGCNGDRCRGGANGNGENKARGRHRHGLLCPHGLVPALIVREVRTFLARRPDPDAREVFFGTRGRIRSVAGYPRQGQTRCEAGAQSPRTSEGGGRAAEGGAHSQQTPSRRRQGSVLLVPRRRGADLPGGGGPRFGRPRPSGSSWPRLTWAPKTRSRGRGCCWSTTTTS